MNQVEIPTEAIASSKDVNIHCLTVSNHPWPLGNCLPQLHLSLSISLQFDPNIIGEVFSKQQALSLPSHRPYDCAIELLPGDPLPTSRKTCPPKRNSIEKYIHDFLAAGLIRPSSSPLGAGFFLWRTQCSMPTIISWDCRHQARNHPPSILCGSCSLLGETLLTDAKHSQPHPSDGPANRLFVPDSVRSQVLQWGHFSKLHP